MLDAKFNGDSAVTGEELERLREGVKAIQKHSTGTNEVGVFAS